MGSGGFLLGVPRTTLTSLKAARAVGPSVEPNGGRGPYIILKNIL